MAKIALLFPGQGSQTVGMGRALAEAFPAARATFDEADAALGFPLSQLIFDGPEDQLRLTEHTQPAILTTSIAAWRVLEPELQKHNLTSAFAAGHSLGEYSAHVAAGTFSFADAVRAVRLRGRYMQEAVPAGEGAMAAILGLPAARLSERGAQASADAPRAAAEPTPASSPTATSAEHRAVAAASIVAPANLNSPDQTVISGSTSAVTRAAELCKEAGAKRTVMLPVSAPFHCQLMHPAQERLATDLESIPFSDPHFPVAANVDALLLARGPEVRDALIRQVTGAVRWVECMQLLIRGGATHYIEVGPGKVLCGLLRQIDREQKSLNVEDPASLEKTIAALTALPTV